MSEMNATDPAFTQLPVTTFLNELASKAPIPGGGGVAALSGALSSGLISMVANLTLAGKKYAAVAAEVHPLLEEAEQLRADFTRLVEDDAQVYQQLATAYKLPRGTTEEISLRLTSIQYAAKQATQVPLRIVERSIYALRLCQRLSELDQVAAVSDIGVATILARAALQGASLMVETNLHDITDSKFVDSVQVRLKEYTYGTETAAKEALERVHAKIKG